MLWFTFEDFQLFRHIIEVCDFFSCIPFCLRSFRHFERFYANVILHSISWNLDTPIQLLQGKFCSVVPKKIVLLFNLKPIYNIGRSDDFDFCVSGLRWMELPFGQVLADKHHVVKKEDVHVHLEKERFKLRLCVWFWRQTYQLWYLSKIRCSRRALFSKPGPKTLLLK